MSTDNDKFNYCVARYWNGKDGSLCVYAYCGSEIHYGNQEQAEDLLEYVKRNSKHKDYKIVKIDA